MKEYKKIKNVLLQNAKTKQIVVFAEPFNSLQNINWIGTEQIDGINIQIHWDGFVVKTVDQNSNTVIPKELAKLLHTMFECKEMEYVFENVFGKKEVLLYGEGYGGKIQKGKEYSITPNFILFDIMVNGVMLRREEVLNAATKLGIKCVPIVFRGTLREAANFIKGHPVSTLGSGKHEMEGLILQPNCENLYLLNNNNTYETIKCKCSYAGILRDVTKFKKDSMFFKKKPL